MTVQQMEYFISIVDTGSFSQASVIQNTTQSSVSKQISALEDELGVQLFNRTRRKIKLTPAGEAFAAYARKNIKAYYNMKNDMLSYADRRESSITVGMHCLATHYDTWQSLMDFHALYPQFMFKIKKLPTWDIIEALKTHECNFGILYDGDMDTSKYNTLPLVSDHLVLAVPEHHHLSNHQVIGLEELCNEKLAFTADRTQMQHIAIKACRKVGFEPKIDCIESFPEPLLALMKIRGAGVLFPEKALNYYALEGIKVIHLKEEYPVNLVLIRPIHSKLTVAEKSFINYLRQHPDALMIPPELKRVGT